MRRKKEFCAVVIWEKRNGINLIQGKCYSKFRREGFGINVTCCYPSNLYNQK